MSDKSDKDLTLKNEEVFGKRAYYNNMVMHDKTYNAIYEQLKKTGKKWRNRSGKYMTPEPALQWVNYSPLSQGPRYEQVREAVGEIAEDVLYIITPKDTLYTEDPTLELDKE